MPRIVNGTLISVASGRHGIPALALPDANDRITCRLKRCTSASPLTWPNTSTQINLTVEVSYDGGQTWEFLLGATSIGGIHINRDGTEATETTLGGTLRSGVGRRIRCFVDVINGPLVSEFSLDAN